MTHTPEPQPIGHADLDGLPAERLREMLVAARQVCEEYAIEANGLRRELTRLRAHNDAQHRTSETATANYLALQEGFETLREACEIVLEYLTFCCGCNEQPPCPDDCPAQIVRAALAATAPEGEANA